MLFFFPLQNKKKIIKDHIQKVYPRGKLLKLTQAEENSFPHLVCFMRNYLNKLC